ncbi:hypothetical protein [Gulosibacter bifidus]|uniref:hypothetical protein n=1 Tax=Gulosibacter bifidus TaxID=272239 RepID=UPI0013520D88|nr:hypothetical protein [Gulosibacter bifidus]
MAVTLGLLDASFGLLSASAQTLPPTTTPTPTETAQPVEEPAEPAGPTASTDAEATPSESATQDPAVTPSEEGAPVEPNATPEATTAPTSEGLIRPRGMVSPMSVAGTTATCSAGTFYSITEAGYVYKVNQTSGAFSSTYQANSSTSTTSIGSPGLTYAGSRANSLGIGKGGSTAYALEANGSQIYAVKTYSAAKGTWTSTDIRNTSGTVGRTYAVDGVTMVPVTGVVDPFTGKYYVGGYGVKSITETRYRWEQQQVWVSYYPVGSPYYYHGSPYYYQYGYWTTQWVEVPYTVTTSSTPVFILMEYDEANRTFKSMGSFPITGMASSALNGDMAFDAAGNLLAVANEGSGGLTSVISIPSSEIQRARTSTTPVVFKASQSTPKPFGLTGDVNGLAFSSDGRTYIGSRNGVWYGDYGKESKVRSDYWPNDGYQYGLVTDLASCATPSTISLQKDVVGRYGADDNFRIVIEQSSDIYGENTTTGENPGIQTEQVGPLPAITGTSYTIRETMPRATDASGNPITPPIDATKYDVSYKCSANGTQFASGVLSSSNNYAAQVTVPNTPSVAVNCVITNTPRKALAVRKQWVVDGTVYPLGDTPAGLPAGLTADLILDGQPAQWATKYTYDATERVGINETTTAGRCEVKQSLQYYNGTAMNSGLPYDAGLKYGENTAVIKNEVTCDTKLTLVKQVEGGNAKPEEWSLTAKDPSGATTVSGAGTATATVKPDTQYSLAESTGNPLYVPNKTAAGDVIFTCVETDASGNPISGTDFTDTPDSKVTLPKGADVKCTVVNRTAKLTVQKHVTGDSATLTPDKFQFTAKPASGVTGLNPVANVPGANTTTTTNTFNVRPGHNYTVTEGTTPGNENLAYVNTAVERLDANGNWVAIDPATIKVPAGEHWTIRYVNTSPGAPALPLTGGLTGMLPIFGAGSALGILALAAWYVLRRKPTGPLLG